MRRARRNEKAVVFRTFAIHPLYLRVVEAGLGDTRLEVVDDHPLRHPFKVGERPPVQRNPRRQGLVEDKLDVQMTAERVRHDEGPRLPQRIGGCVEHPPRIAEVDVALGAGLAFDPHDGFRGLGVDALQKAIDGGARPGVALLVEPLENGRTVDACGMHLLDQFPIGLDGRDVLGRWERLQGGRYELPEALHQGQRLLQEMVLLRPRSIAIDRAPIEAGGALNGADVGRSLQVAQQGANVHQVGSTSCHDFSRRGCMILVGRIEVLREEDQEVCMLAETDPVVHFGRDYALLPTLSA